MRHRLIGVGATIAAVVVVAVLVAAQDGTAERQAGAPSAVQGLPPGGQAGPGLGPGQMRGRGPQQGQGTPQQGRGRGMNAPGPGRDGFGPLGALDLTEDQRVTINGVQRASRDQAAPLEDELEFVRKSLHRELFADTRDSGKIASLSARSTALQKQLADLHVKTATSVSDVLTEEQRETMRLREGRGAGRGPGR
jgi:Spy/CpxP family protein refolding chaperone